MNVVDNAIAAYREHFGAMPTAAAIAPGRVEIMGNHTDYNGGFVLSAALDLQTVVVGSPTSDGSITLYAADFDQESTASSKDLLKKNKNIWANYVLGVVDELQKAGAQINGFQAAIKSTVPAGAGLSSSASIEVATALFLQQIYPYELEKMQIAQLCRRAENNFVGVNCGVMDQFSSLFGQTDSCLFLDCLTLEHEIVPMGRKDQTIVICNSGVKHSLSAGDYNTRRDECMASAAHFGKSLLRNVTWEEFLAREHELPENRRKRARHVLTENQRVLAMRQSMFDGDTSQTRQIMAEGHASCRDLFENSTRELDFLVDLALTLEGCYGSRMTGGGWGGCTVNLVHIDAVDRFAEQITAHYQQRFSREATFIISKASDGARELSKEELSI